VKPRLLISVVAVVALVIAGAAVIILTANQPERPNYSSYAREPSRTPVIPTCPDTITVTFATDEELRRQAPMFENDSRYYNPDYVTKAQAYDRIKDELKNQPELLKLIKPESLPASVTVYVSRTGDLPYLVNQLKDRYGPANVASPCGTAASSTRPPVPTTTTVTR
jgi:hypothetical protein